MLVWLGTISCGVPDGRQGDGIARAIPRSIRVFDHRRAAILERALVRLADVREMAKETCELMLQNFVDRGRSRDGRAHLSCLIRSQLRDCSRTFVPPCRLIDLH